MNKKELTKNITKICALACLFKFLARLDSRLHGNDFRWKSYAKLNTVFYKVVMVCILCSTLPLIAIKPTRTFVDFLNRTDWHAYSKDIIHSSMARNAATALIASGATCSLANRHRAQNTEDKCNLGESAGSSNSFMTRVDWAGACALLTACIATKKVTTCCRLWNIIKTSNMPTVRSEQFQASLAHGMQPNSYYWQSKPWSNMFWR